MYFNKLIYNKKLIPIMRHIVKFSEYLKEELTSAPNFRNELIKLIGEGDVDKIDKFMDENDIDPDYDSGMISRLAAKQGNLDLIKYLSEVGADLTIRNNLTLKTALLYGKVEVAGWLLDDLSLGQDDMSSILTFVMESDIPSNAEKAQAKKLLSFRRGSFAEYDEDE